MSCLLELFPKAIARGERADARARAPRGKPTVKRRKETKRTPQKLKKTPPSPHRLRLGPGARDPLPRPRLRQRVEHRVQQVARTAPGQRADRDQLDARLPRVGDGRGGTRRVVALCFCFFCLSLRVEGGAGGGWGDGE